MKRDEIELLLREAGKLARETEFFMIGSQAAHAYSENPPAEVLLSQECDIYPKNRPETALFLDVKLGPKSPFATDKGYYADVVTPDLATLPAAWESRVKPLPLGLVTALCLDINDLLVSKLTAGRLKDMEFAAALLHLGFAEEAALIERIELLDSESDRTQVQGHLQIVMNDLRAANKARGRQ
ncbi:MAG: hypothetical protein JWM99_4465 [Verrucomicrobiales bacterium]|nr:hypothetical protein [Verrucomicrobiales bacterium]